MGNRSSSLLVDRVGMLLFALYQVMVTIVLVNILIAMMSHSFEDVQVLVATMLFKELSSPVFLVRVREFHLLHLPQTDNDVEWKFARTKLWMNYIDECNTLPVPFNMLPTPKSVKFAYKFIEELFRGPDDIEKIHYDFSVSFTLFMRSKLTNEPFKQKWTRNNTQLCWFNTETQREPAHVDAGPRGHQESLAASQQHLLRDHAAPRQAIPVQTRERGRELGCASSILSQLLQSQWQLLSVVVFERYAILFQT